MLAQISNDPLFESRSQLAQGLAPQAEVSTRAYLKTHPESVDGHYLLAEVLFREKKPKESLAEFTSGAKGRRPSAREFGIIASNYVLLGSYADADRWFTEATLADPNDANYFYLLGRTKYKEGAYEEAVAAFQRAVVLQPKYIEAENNCGLAFLATQKKELAKQAFQSAIDWQGSTATDAQPYLNLGAMLVEENDLAAGASLLKQAVAISPDNPRIHEELGKAYMQQGIPDLARRELEEAVRLAPDTASLHFRLGQLYKKEKLAELAEREFTICARLSGTHSSAVTPNPFDADTPRE